MFIKYDKQYDILWLALREVQICGGKAVNDTIHLDFDRDGNVCGLVIESTVNGIDLKGVPRKLMSTVQHALQYGGFALKLAPNVYVDAMC